MLDLALNQAAKPWFHQCLDPFLVPSVADSFRTCFFGDKSATLSISPLMMKVSFGTTLVSLFETTYKWMLNQRIPQKTHPRRSTCPRIKGTTLLALHGGVSRGRMEFPKRGAQLADEIDGHVMSIKFTASYVPWSKVAILGMVIPPLIGILLLGPYKPLLLG